MGCNAWALGKVSLIFVGYAAPRRGPRFHFVASGPINMGQILGEREDKVRMTVDGFSLTRRIRGAVFLLIVLVPGAAPALPPDPQRPLQARTCAEAEARLAKAQAGSPLISAAETAGVLARAMAQVSQLCDRNDPIQTLKMPSNRLKALSESSLKKGVSCRP